MARNSCGRGALAMALVGAFASSVEATEWRSGIVVDSGSAAQMDPGDILRVSGDNAIGIRVAARASFDADGILIIHEGAGRAPAHAYGILALQGADLSLARSRVDVRGRRSIGLRAQRGASIELRDTAVRLSGSGEDSAALGLAGGTATLSGSTIDAGGGYAISTHFSGSDTARVITQDSHIRGRIATGDTPLDMFADGGRIDGDIAREGAGALDLRMQRGAWLGNASRLSSLSLEESTWTVTADSDVSALHLGRGGRVGFDRAGSGFSTLRVGAWQADEDAGGIEVGTRLDAGGPLRRQATDRLLVTGDVSGITPVHVVNAGGAGASTSGRDGVNGPADGISLVQVGGKASADAFRLAGDYVAVGPWQYRLHAYAPGDSDARQRLLDGEGGYWDFRLQSTNVSGPDALRGGRAGSLYVTRSALLPQVPAYLVLSHALLGYGAAALDALGNVEPDVARDPALHVRTFGGNVDYRSTLPFAGFGVDYRRHDRGLQVAGDLLVHALGDTTLRAGMAASLGGTRISPRAIDGRSEARVDARGIAWHVSLLNENDWRVSSTYAITHYRVDMRTPSRGEVLGRLRANANEAVLAAAYRWRSGHDRLLIEPGAAVTWQRLRYSRGVDSDNVELLGGAPERLTLRGGARASFQFEPAGEILYAWTPYVDVRYNATRGSGESVSLSGERFETGRAGRGAELSTGANFQLWSNVTAHVAAVRRFRIGRSGEAGFAARASVAVSL